MTDERADFSIRAITAGVNLSSLTDTGAIERASDFLAGARSRLSDAGYHVQGIRIATQPLDALCSSAGQQKAIDSIRRLDDHADTAAIDLSLGPLITDDRDAPDFSSWAADLAAATKRSFFSVSIASPEIGVHERTVAVAAATIASLAGLGDNGQVNFRFAATACVRPSTPFFPAAYHEGPPAFSIALEGAPLVSKAFAPASSPMAAAESLRNLLELRLRPLERLAKSLETAAIRFAGIDLSPAPSLEASITQPLEGLAGAPFGAPSTLAACAAVTRALEAADVAKCGFSGLMLPVLEDRVLAHRASEGRIGIHELLLFSSICGTGLDLVPLPGACTTSQLGGLILDVASLAARWNKPLAARLLPIPGRAAGDEVDFTNPHLTGSVVLPVD